MFCIAFSAFPTLVSATDVYWTVSYVAGDGVNTASGANIYTGNVTASMSAHDVAVLLRALIIADAAFYSVTLSDGDISFLGLNLS
jgi:hypothetical protein